MILVLLGTNPYSFTRLAEAADKYAESSKEKIFMQLGHTEYLPLYASYKRFMSKPELLEKIRESDLVITQGGFGSIADSLLAGKKVIAVPRKPELGESPDEQEELVKELEKMGRILAVYDIKKLPELIEKARHKEFPSSKNMTIPTLINNFLSGN